VSFVAKFLDGCHLTIHDIATGNNDLPRLRTQLMFATAQLRLADYIMLDAATDIVFPRWRAHMHATMLQDKYDKKGCPVSMDKD